MKKKFIDYYMTLAEATSKLSYAKRLQVGAVIVTPNNVVLTGYNGMPTDWENTCEHKEETYDERDTIISDSVDWTYDPNTKKYSRLKTKPEVLHAESNAITKVARSTESSVGATLFCTHAPCIECAKMIYQSGISTVYFKHYYKNNSGLVFLKQGGIDVHQYTSIV